MDKHELDDVLTFLEFVRDTDCGKDSCMKDANMGLAIVKIKAYIARTRGMVMIKMEDIPPEFKKILDENFNDILA